MRTRKSTVAPSALKNSALTRLGQSVLNYIDLFVRTICIILGLVVSGWVKFIDETTPTATNRVSMASPTWSPSRQLAPLPGTPATAAHPTFTGQPPVYR